MTPPDKSLDELSPSEILNHVLAIGEGIKSLQAKATSVNERDSNRTKHSGRTIRVADDLYIESRSRAPSKSEINRLPPEIREQIAERVKARSEILFYRGQTYCRLSAGGKWLSSDEYLADQGISQNQVRQAEVRMPPGAYGIDPSTLSSIARLPNETIEGRRFIRLSADFGLAGPDPFAGHPDSTSDRMLQSAREHWRRTAPDRYGGKLDLWIGVDDLYIRQIKRVTYGYNQGRVLSSEETITKYSRFNQAVLPGLLPD